MLCIHTVVLKKVQTPTYFLLKIFLKLIYLDNVEYLTEHLTAAQLCLSTIKYCLQRSGWKQLENS